ncbi:MAG TPA: ABC transporter permease subunit [Bauldia sp.]|nr:ABC transporter permease subunit [Bauldia sp.]
MSGRRNPAGVFTRGTAFLAVLLGGIALFLLYTPIVGLAVLSFGESPLSGIPWPLTIHWYSSPWGGGNANWVEPLPISVGVGLIVAALPTAAALVIGRLLPVIRHRGGVLAAYLSVLVMPGILIGIAVLIFYRGLIGIRTGLWSVVLVHFIWALPFALLCILIVSVRFDHRLLEAARDLGADRWRAFRDIELPILKPGISASVFFSFLLSFNELPRTLYTRGGITTLPYYIWTASAAHSSQVSLIYALSAIIMAVSFVIILIATRTLMRSN